MATCYRYEMPDANHFLGLCPNEFRRAETQEPIDECSICVTPTVDPPILQPCARGALQYYMTLPASPTTLSLPAALDCEFLDHSMVSTVNSSTWTDHKCLQVGQPISNAFAASLNKKIVLWSTGSGLYASNWYDYNNFRQTKNYTCRETPSSPYNSWSNFTINPVEFRAMLDLNGFFGECFLRFWIETRYKAGGSSGGTYPSAGTCCHSVWTANFLTLNVPHHDQSTSSWWLAKMTDGVPRLYVIADQTPFDGNTFDPFQLTVGAITCRATTLANGGTFNINMTNACAGLLGTFPLLMSPARPTGYIARLTGR